jgi:pyruvate dehydrogenase E2 component (dihydrolipoamide acetyltransferase)
MPQMGADMTEGTIVRWIKHEGDPVERGEIIAEIETDKANVEIEAFESGVFRKVLAQEGDTVDVGIPIAIIAALEDDISKYRGAPSAAKPPQAAVAETPAAKAPAVAPTAADAHREPPTLSAPVSRANGRVRASPVARRLAEERGIDLSTLHGTGPDGRIVRRDVEAAQGGATASVSTARPVGPPQPVAMSKMRQTIARRMAQSKREAPHYYVTVDIDMSEAENIRHQLNDLHHNELHVSVNDLIVTACAIALARHPMFNTWFIDGTVQQNEAINVCIAIALDDGLIAPAILDCGNKTLVDISQAGRDLAQRAKSGSLKPDEYTGGTFTVSNLGPYDVETLIAIIQPPQTAILGVGSAREVPVVRDGQIVVGHLMKVALSADHRVTDGAQGAKFLNEIRRLLEKPVALLI